MKRGQRNPEEVQGYKEKSGKEVVLDGPWREGCCRGRVLRERFSRETEKRYLQATDKLRKMRNGSRRC